MPPSLISPQPTRHSVPYPTSPSMTLSSNLPSYSRFTELFAPFSPGPLGVWQVPLTPSGLLLLGNLLLFLPLSSAFLRHKNSPSTFYTSRNSISPSPSSHSPSSILFSLQLFFHSWKMNDGLSMQTTSFLLVSSKLRGLPSPSTPLPAPLLSMSAEVHSLMEMILALETLLKKRTLTPPSSLLSCSLQIFPTLPPLYHPVDSLSQIPLCSLLHFTAMECHYIYCQVGLFLHHLQYLLHTRSNSKTVPSNFH